MNLMASSLLILSFLLTLMALFMLWKSIFIALELPFLSISSLDLPISLLMDWTSIMFMSTVLLISSMILVFSLNYIPLKEHQNFKILLLMFILSMLTLIMSDNVIFILLGWDGLGFSSYVLVIYYQNHSSASSGTITILSNRIGDIMILLTIGLIFHSSSWNLHMNQSFPMIVMILLLIAACSKSAQFPFSAWLPAAMAAPTPISALVHSSTLVTAGVFLMLRLMNNPHPTTMVILMVLASMTSLYSSISANWEQDMKKIIALSTLSQIAMMMFAISMNSINIAFFHLITHALFKSTMFMCAGIIIHNSSYQDMRHMGSSFKTLPLTYTTLGVSNLALMGIPFMSGFFSKDAIVEALISSKLSSLLSYLMIFSIGLTASYSLRMSLLSTSPFMKSKPDITTHHPLHFNLAISMMTPFSITTGAMILWLYLPEQSFIIPQSLKLMIPTILMLGALTGTALSFKSKKYTSMGESFISLMFNHFITTHPIQKTFPTMTLLMLNDKAWQEQTGPSKLFSNTKLMSMSPDLATTSMMFTLILITLIPISMIP